MKALFSTSNFKMRLGRLIPWCLFLVFLCDSLSRLYPLNKISFRTWEAANQFRTPLGPFEASAYHELSQAYGDLAALGNLPSLRHYHSEVLTTDAYGFRQNSKHETNSRPIDNLMVGNSFVGGCGLSDEDTLSAQLSKLTGYRFYNGGWMLRDLPHILDLIDRLGNLREGWVLYVYSQDSDPPTPSEGIPRYPLKFLVAEKCRVLFRRWAYGIGHYGLGALVSPMRIVLQKEFRRFEGDQVMPNPFKKNVAVEILKNGTPILFRSFNMSSLNQSCPVDIAAFVAIAQQLSSRHLRLGVILVPAKLYVYGPLCPALPPLPVAFRSYLNDIEYQLKKANIPVINLADNFSLAASQILMPGEYIYHLDDTHWNAKGVYIAAKIIQDRWFPVKNEQPEPVKQ